MNELRNLLCVDPVDIIALTEINQKNRDKDIDNYVLEGYSCITETKGRGVCLFIKDGYDVVRIKEYEQVFQPSIICKIKPQGSDKSFILGVVYRSPSSTPEENNELASLMNIVFSQNMQSNVIMTGDINYPEIDWSREVCNTKDDHCAFRFLEIIQQNFVSQLVTEPTHHRGDQTPNVLDLVLVNQENLTSEVQLAEPIGKSHHSVILFDILDIKMTVSQRVSEKRQVANGDYDGMREYAQNVD